MSIKKLSLLLLFISLSSCIAKKARKDKREQTANQSNIQNIQREEAFNKHLLNIVENNKAILLTAPNPKVPLADLIRSCAHLSDLSHFSNLDPQIYQQCKKNLPKQKPISEYAVTKALFKALKLNGKYQIATFQVDNTTYYKKEKQWYYIKHNKEKILSREKLKAITPQATKITLRSATKPITHNGTIMALFSWAITCGVALGCYISWPKKLRENGIYFLKGKFRHGALKTNSQGGFQNLGNTCYANAGTQGLLMAWPTFFEERKKECHPSQDKEKIALCNDFINLFAKRSNKNVHTYDLLRVFKGLETQNIWTHKGQSDAPEYLGAIFNYFSEDGTSRIYRPNMKLPFLYTYQKTRSNFSVRFAEPTLRKIQNEPNFSESEADHMFKVPIQYQKNDKADKDEVSNTPKINMQTLFDQSLQPERGVMVNCLLNEFLQGYNVTLSNEVQESIKQCLFAKMLIADDGFWKKLIAQKNQFKDNRQFSTYFENKSSEELINTFSQINIKDFKNIIRTSTGALPDEVNPSDVESFKIACIYMKKYFARPENQGDVNTKLTELANGQTIINALQGLARDIISKIMPTLSYRAKEGLQFKYTFENTVKNFQMHSDKFIIQLKRFERDLLGKTNKIDIPVSNAGEININGQTFTLQSFVWHRGSYSFGHYKAYGIENGNYMCYNDSSVTPISQQDFLAASQQGYLYFYKRAQA